MQQACDIPAPSDAYVLCSADASLGAPAPPSVQWQLCVSPGASGGSCLGEGHTSSFINKAIWRLPSDGRSRLPWAKHDVKASVLALLQESGFATLVCLPGFWVLRGPWYTLEESTCPLLTWVHSCPSGCTPAVGKPEGRFSKGKLSSCLIKRGLGPKGWWLLGEGKLHVTKNLRCQ